eukprot:2381508-Rhodomonas_salina.1
MPGVGIVAGVGARLTMAMHVVQKHQPHRHRPDRERLPPPKHSVSRCSAKAPRPGGVERERQCDDVNAGSGGGRGQLTSQHQRACRMLLIATIPGIRSAESEENTTV